MRYTELLLICSVLLKLRERTLAQKEILCAEPIDFGIILDSSDKASSKWQEVLEFTTSLVDFFNVGRLKSHVGLITYGTEAQLVMDFKTFEGDLLTPKNVKDYIQKVVPTGGGRHIDKALKLANERLFTAEAGMRVNKNDIKKIMILLNAGKQTGPLGSLTSLQEASKPLRNKGINIYVVAVGNKKDIDEDELVEITGTPENVLTTESFDQLVNLAEEVSKVACGGKTEYVFSLNDIKISIITC
ncbi:collagen alpha-6(VI) chain-like isoform X2 [Stylophora pistillata]|uniref:collagen alpha-6(VI) chain-like isoform X2 n=1 Tax=Stylophora pistillata TaxID=50429 RepID=UPI000C04EA1B|nr:collagen alpha-6(VI) chain-like isoform X2 [Stylophora pistillata]